MQSLSVPLLTFGGSGDTFTPAEWNIYVTNEHASSAQKALVVLQGGDHYMLGDKCSVMPWLSEIGLAFICSDPVWDMDRAHDLINQRDEAVCRCLRTARDIKTGEIFTREMIDVLRPATPGAIRPDQVSRVVGTLAIKDIPSGKELRWVDLGE